MLRGVCAECVEFFPVMLSVVALNLHVIFGCQFS
jgi:hypothetical protein